VNHFTGLTDIANLEIFVTALYYLKQEYSQKWYCCKYIPKQLNTEGFVTIK